MRLGGLLRDTTIWILLDRTTQASYSLLGGLLLAKKMVGTSRTKRVNILLSWRGATSRATLTHTFDQLRHIVVLLARLRPTSRYNDGRCLRATARKTYFPYRGRRLLDTSTLKYISRSHRRAYSSPTGGLLLDTKRGVLPDTEEHNVNLAARRPNARYDDGMATSR